MFDDALLESRRDHRFGERKKSLPIAIALHAATIAAFVGATMWKTGEPPEPVIPVVFPVSAALPPPPIGTGVHRATETRPNENPHPAVQPAPLLRDAPPTVAALPPPSDDEPASPGSPGFEAPGDPFGAQGGTGVLPTAGSETAAGDSPIRIVGGDVKAPVLITQIDPDYPESMRRARMEGVVILEAVITASGDVDDVRILKTAGAVLDRAASDAVRRWRYRPATLNGRTVSVYLTVTVTFGLHS